MYKKYVPLIVIVLVGFGVYANSFRGEFILDDDPLIRNNIFVRSSSPVSSIFTKDIGESSGKKLSFWRPLQILTYRVEYSLFKLNVTGYHLTNITLHIAVALMLYWLVSLLFGDRGLSFLTSIFFVIHPIHTEAVSYISGRADSLVVLFMLLCFICYIKYLDKKNFALYICMLCSYTLALLSRENSLVLPVLLLLYHYTFRKKIEFFGLFSLTGIAAVYGLLRFTFLKSLLPYFTVSYTLLQRIPGFFVALTNYLKLLVVPFPLHMEYGNKIFAINDIRAIIGVVILLALILCAFRTRKNKLIFFAVFWFLIALVPQSNLYPIGAYMAEHWLYLASIGFFLVVGRLLASSYRKRKISTVILIVTFITSLGVLTIKQNTYWQDSIGFYERTLQYEPASFGAYNNLGLIYQGMGKYDEAITYYKKAIEINPNFAESYNNIGLIFYRLAKYNEAIPFYEMAIKVNQKYAEGYSNLGALYSKVGNTDKAIALLKRALEISPHYVSAYNNLGLTYLASGKHKLAIAACNKAIEIKPADAEAYNNLGLIYYDLGKHQDAISAYKKALELKSADARTYYNLGIVYQELSNYKEAIASYKKAIEIKPADAEAHNNLAVAYYDTKQYDLAVQHCQRAIELGHEVSPQFLEMLKPYRKK
ncbi:MAG: tetratricopeptide repeat protein [Candidatus Omnitrophota bacterium]|nr:MAG: tetratricopeptide repeat protein [Candidatus Omnitrophota bacterium]